MNDAIQLLERLGATGDVDAALVAALPPAVGDAWRNGDVAGLRLALGAQAEMMCSILAPEEDAPLEEPAQPDERPDEQESNAA